MSGRPEEPHRHTLTPIAGEQQVRSQPLEIGKPSLGDRWRRRRRLRVLPTGTTWQGQMLTGTARYVGVLACVVGGTYLLAWLVGWEHGHALGKTFMIVGGALVAGTAAGFGFSPSRYGGTASSMYPQPASATQVMKNRDVSRTWGVAFFSVGMAVFALGLYIDATT